MKFYKGVVVIFRGLLPKEKEVSEDLCYVMDRVGIIVSLEGSNESEIDVREYQLYSRVTH